MKRTVRLAIGETVASAVQFVVFIVLISRFGSWPFAANLAATMVGIVVGQALPAFAARRSGEGCVSTSSLAFRCAIGSGLALIATAAPRAFPVIYAIGLATLPLINAVSARRWPLLAARTLSCRPSSVVLVSVSVVLMSPALFAHPLNGHDAYFHSVWQQQLAEQLWRGEIYPRWLMDMNLAFGSPAFFHYPPLPHLLTALLAYPILPSLDDVQARLAMSATLALVIGAIGFRQWMRALSLSEASATLAALTYVIGPYHLFVDTYLRTSFGELWAFAWAPWVFMGLSQVARWRGFVAATLAMAATAISNLPSSLFLFPAFGLYVIMNLRRADYKRDAGIALAAFACAIMISAAYLWPALGQASFISQADLFTGDLDPTSWLLGPHQRPTRLLLILALVLGLQTALVLGAVFALMAMRSEWRRHRATGFAIAALLVTTFMMTEAARPIWALGTVFNKMQFPWRLLTLHTVVLALVLGLTFEALRRKFPRPVPQLMALSVLGGLLLANAAFYLQRMPGGPFEGSERRSLYVEHWDPAEYRLGDAPRAAAFFGAGRDRVVILEGRGRVAVQRFEPRQIELAVQASTPMRFALRQFAYTGWSYQIDGSPWLQAESLARPVAVVAISVPAGDSRVRVRLTPTLPERLGWFTSCAGVLVAAIFALLLWRRDPLAADA